jgi:hypothetical protein
MSMMGRASSLPVCGEAAANSLFSPAGRRWPEGPDEGAQSEDWAADALSDVDQIEPRLDARKAVVQAIEAVGKASILGREASDLILENAEAGLDFRHVVGKPVHFSADRAKMLKHQIVG